MVALAASLLSADPAYLIREAEQAGRDRFHIDVMDGRFAPNIAFGPQIVDRLKFYTRKPFFFHQEYLELDNVVFYLHIRNST